MNLRSSSPLSFYPILLRRNPRILTAVPLRKRRRRGRPPPPAISCQLPLEPLFQALIPSLAAAAASAAAFAAFSRPSELGEWTLFATPTPFNRSVLLRCPSIAFSGEGDGIVTRGRIPAVRKGESLNGERIAYQRVCVGTEDGGVISLDWPAELELGKECGLDTTVLIVPGTAQGSMDKHVTVFVGDALKNGYFPVVMNPRGCAGSPLTTPRLFTAADSNDICTAIQFVNKLRPWTTLMSVGWGYGANMLTKYLAESGETTPLTAAVCIDNPFDLEEATSSFPYHVVMDRKLTGGLIEILRANKELFQGKSKGFDLAKALSATSIRDFDRALSMVSYGLSTIEEFYSKASTRQMIDNVKIPVLFMQSDDGTVPLFSVPRSSITENPFTSLLLCSCLPSAIKISEKSTNLWCQQLAIEWLSAVELSLLRGRHPLLKDVDITINPSKGPVLVNGRISGMTIPSGNKTRGRYDPAQWFLSHKDAYEDPLLNTQSTVNGFLIGSHASVPKDNDGAVQEVKKHPDLRSALHEMQKDCEDVGSKDGGDGPIDSEGSQVLQTASVVMNMLDVTMPGTLEDDQKKKVLAAVEQGETLMKALQGAVPDDVRGKLTNAVTEIMQTQHTNLNLEGLKRIGWIPKMTSGLKSRIQEESKESSSADDKHDDIRLSDTIANGIDTEGRPQDDSAYSDSGNSSTQESIESSQEKAAQFSGYTEAGLEKGSKPGQAKKSERANVASDEAVSEHNKVHQINDSADKHPTDDQMVVKDDVHNSEQKRIDSVAEQNMPNSLTKSEEALSAGTSSSEQQIIEKEGSDIRKNEDKSAADILDQHVHSSSTKLEEPSPSHSPAKAPSISVTQALDALTGFDDSTQMAVNSVFGVIENMIDQFEKASNEENSDDVNNIDAPGAKAESLNPNDNENRSGSESNVVQTSNQVENVYHKEDAGFHSEVKDNLGETKVSYSVAASVNNRIRSVKENDVAANHLEKRILSKLGHVQNFPVDVALNKYWQSPYAAYLHRYFSTQLPTMKSLELESATDLFLDPDEGQWKMIDHAGNSKNAINETGENQSISGRAQKINSSSQKHDSENIIEPSYVILDNEYSSVEFQSSEEYDAADVKEDDAKKEELMFLIKNALLDALKVEVGRKLGMPDLKELDKGIVYDLEGFSDAVSHSVVHDHVLNFNLFSENNGTDSVKFGTLKGEHVVRTISSAVQDTSHLTKVLPVGVIVGSSLASLRTYFQVVDEKKQSAGSERSVSNYPEEPETVNSNNDGIKEKLAVVEKEQSARSDSSISREPEELETVDSNNGGIMVGAVTAALGASALLAHHQQQTNYKQDDTMGISSGSSNGKGFSLEEHARLDEAMQEKDHNNLVGSLAEKAMSVAGPIVPTKSDGEVDHERLVTILAELGQKGGILRLIGKIALLWGGIRGAMSLTDRLISFLHIAERPLFQRIFGFVCMVLILWSPIVIPLLPTLVQSWTTNTSNGIAGYVCVVGVYVAILILLMLWGRRIRGYENPLEQYGLDFASTSRIYDFLKGLVGGVTIVLCIHSINALLGYARLSFSAVSPLSSAVPLVLLKIYGNGLLLAVRGVVTATGIAIVEELLFRSWLFEEVATDLGYYRAILISALAFSLIQRSLPSMPGFMLLSLALFGIKQRTHNKIYATIGMRAGIMTTNFILQAGGFLTYWPSTPFWLASTHPWHPFEGAVGMCSCAFLAILFYPKPQYKESSKTIQE